MASDSSGAPPEDEWAWTRAQVSRIQPKCRIARRTVLSRPSHTFARALASTTEGRGLTGASRWRGARHSDPETATAPCPCPASVRRELR